MLGSEQRRQREMREADAQIRRTLPETMGEVFHRAERQRETKGENRKTRSDLRGRCQQEKVADNLVSRIVPSVSVRVQTFFLDVSKTTTRVKKITSIGSFIS